MGEKQTAGRVCDDNHVAAIVVVAPDGKITTVEFSHNEVDGKKTMGKQCTIGSDALDNCPESYSISSPAPDSLQAVAGTNL